MTAKNIIIYIIITLIGFIGQLISYIFYWIPFLFRHKVLRFAQARFENDITTQLFVLKPSVKKWKLYIHPYFWMFCFTTGLTDNYCGPEWYKKELKKKWFYGWADIDFMFNCKLNFYKTFKEKLRYFYLCYSWQGCRNACWALNEWFFREGKFKGEITVVKKYCWGGLRYVCFYPDIIPMAIFMDRNNENIGNSGCYLRYDYMATGIDNIWQTTNEGLKIITFTTQKNNVRFQYGYCRIIKLKKRFLIIELSFGWNWWNGIRVTVLKFMFKKIDSKALADYLEY